MRNRTAAETDKLKAQIRDLIAENNRLRELPGFNIPAPASTTSKLQAALEKAKNDIALLETLAHELRFFRDSYPALAIKNEKDNAELQSLRDQLAEEKRSHAETKERLITSQTHISGLENELAALQEEVTKMRQAEDQYLKKLGGLEQEIKRLLYIIGILSYDQKALNTKINEEQKNADVTAFELARARTSLAMFNFRRDDEAFDAKKHGATASRAGTIGRPPQ